MGSGGSDSEEGQRQLAGRGRLQFAGFDASPKLKVLFKFALVKASTSTKHQAQVENPEKKEHLRALCSLRLQATETTKMPLCKDKTCDCRKHSMI